jgi:hypothetical protein
VNEFAGQPLKLIAYVSATKTKKRGGVMETQDNNTDPNRGGFCTQDIIWAVGVWSVILSLSPVVMFYVLMVI